MLFAASGDGNDGTGGVPGVDLTGVDMLQCCPPRPLREVREEARASQVPPPSGLR